MNDDAKNTVSALEERETISSLEEVYGKPIEVRLRTGTVQVRELGLPHYDIVFAVAELMFASAAGGDDAMAFIAKNKGALIPFVAAAAGMKESEVEQLPGSEGMRLLRAARKANTPFLSQIIEGRFGAGRSEVLAMIHSHGQAPSPT